MLLLSISAYVVNAQTYCQPTATLPAWAHAETQSLHTFKVSSGGTTLLNYEQASATNSYNWLQASQSFSVTPGQTLSIDVYSGIWSWEIVLGFDWDANGVFETEYRAFSAPGAVITQPTSAWGNSSYDTDTKRKALETEYGTYRSVIRHTFTVNVPADAVLGTYRVRVICDGDGNNGIVPLLKFCDKVSYAGSMHDFAINVMQKAATPVISPVTGSYPAPQNITITSETTDAVIYYTLDGTTPTTTVTETNKLYAGAFSLSNDATVKAIATKTGMMTSGVAEANIAFTTTGFNGNQTSKAYAFIKDNKLNIADVEPNTVIAIYTVAGKLIASETANNSSYTFNADLTHGVYLVKVGDKTIKLIK